MSEQIFPYLLCLLMHGRPGNEVSLHWETDLSPFLSFLLQATEAVEEAKRHDPECPHTHYLAFKLALLQDQEEQGNSLTVKYTILVACIPIMKS